MLKKCAVINEYYSVVELLPVVWYVAPPFRFSKTNAPYYIYGPIYIGPYTSI